MRRYRLLLFDADETLFDYSQAEADALRAAFGHFGLDYDPERHLTLYRQINEHVWREFEQHLIDAATLRIERFHRYFDTLETQVNPEDFSRVYLQGLSRGTALIRGAYETVATLAPYYTLSLLSNGLSDVQRPRFRDSRINSYFPVRVISEEIGIAKPHPGIFEYALKACNHTDKSTVLMIGDSLTSDIAGGIAFGIDTCWFNPRGLPAPSETTPTYIIRQLSELPMLLAR